MKTSSSTIMYSNTQRIETNHCYKYYVSLPTKPICIETINFFSKFLLWKSSEFCSPVSFVENTTLPYFEPSIFLLTGLESFEICIKLIPCVESCSFGLTHWVRLKLTSILLNNRLANISGLADVGLVSNSFTFEHFWRSSNPIFPKFWKQIFVAFCEWIKLCTGVTVQANVGQVRQWTSKLAHISTFVVIKLNHFLHSLQCWDNVFVIVPAQKLFGWLQFFLLPYFLQVGIVLCSSRGFFRESHFDQQRLCRQTTSDQLFAVWKLFFKKIGVSKSVVKSSLGRKFLVVQ